MSYRIAMLVERDALFKLSTRGFSLRGDDQTTRPQKRVLLTGLRSTLEL